MKKISLLLIMLITFSFYFNVSAKDTVISMNKYQEEKFLFIEDSYTATSKKDGKITGGYVLKEEIEQDDDTKYKDYQVIVVKYDNNNQIVWKYNYGKTKEDYLDYLEYSYDSDGKIDGYLLSVLETSDIDTESSNETIFIKLSLNGKEELQKPLGLNKNIKINKIISTYNDQGIIDGYIAIGNNNDASYLIKLDNSLNVIWQKETLKDTNNSIKYLDLIPITNEKRIVGYATIKESIDSSNKNKVELIRYNQMGDMINILSDELIKYDSYNLATSVDGFILYGATPEVKLSKGKDSYYLINYNHDGEVNWETIGEVPLNKEKKIKLLPITKDLELKEYLLMYSNDIDSSSEVVKISKDGEIKDKVKKIYDEYYTIEDFIFSNNVLYLIGQINCPEDDTCEYDSNSLLLVSSEEKVIEVKDNDSKNILIITGVIIVLIISVLLIRKKKVLSK